MSLIGNFLAFAIWIYLMVLTVRAVLSLIPLFVRDWQPRGPLLVVAEFVYTLTDPPLRFLRRFIPPLQIGGTRWDIGFLVLYFGLSLLMRVVPVVFG